MTTRRPRIGRQRSWSFPAATELVLPNGLRVWVFDLPGQYVISAGLALDLPLTSEPFASEGIAHVTAHALEEGTLAHPGASFTEVLENTGAVIGGGVTQVATHIGIDVPVLGLRTAFPLFAEAVRTPALADDDVLRHVGLRRAEIQQVVANSSQLAGALTLGAVFADTCRASRPAGGMTGTLETIEPEATREFHDAHYGPHGATLVIAGDFAGLDPLAMAEEAFGDWSGPTAPHHHEDLLPAARQRRLISRPGAVQADIRIAAPAIDRADPRWPAFQVACAIVGGTFQSRLNTELRERRGYTYGVYMSASPLRRDGFATVSGSFRTEVVAAAVDEALHLLDVASKPFNAREVSRAVSYLTRTAPLRYATATGVAQQALTLATLGLDWRHVDTLAAQLATVTAEEATAAFIEIWPEDPAVLVVGDPSLAAGLGVDAEPTPNL